MSSVYTEYFELLSEHGQLQEIQNKIDISGGGVFRFESFLWDVMSGEINLNLDTILELLEDVAFSGLNTWPSDLIRIIGIALIAAVFSNFSFSFQNSSVSDTAFYVSYVMLYGILASTFYTAYQITAEAIGHITELMKVIVPSYCIAITFGSGATTSVYWYEAIMILITLVEMVLLKFVLPLIGVHMTVNLAGNLANENLLSKLCEIVEMIVGWCLKGMSALVLGISGIQGMLAPAIDRVKRTAIIKSMGSLPGIGNAIDGVNETILGAGILIKDAFGAAGMIAISVISMIPMIRLAMYALVYKAEAAIIQPVSDKRIVNSINAASKSSVMMLKTVFTACMLFFIAIAVVTYSCL